MQKRVLSLALLLLASISLEALAAGPPFLLNTTPRPYTPPIASTTGGITGGTPVVEVPVLGLPGIMVLALLLGLAGALLLRR